MMNDNFNSSNLTAQQHLSIPPHLGNASSQPTLNTYFNADQQTSHRYVQSLESLYNDPRHFSLSSTNLDKGCASSIAPLLTNMGSGQGNTILITNNIAHPNGTTNCVPNQSAALSVASAANIRFITAASDVSHPITSENLQQITGSVALTSASSLPTQHIYSINNNHGKDVQHSIFSTHLLQQPNFPSATSTKLAHHHFGTVDVSSFDSDIQSVPNTTAVLSSPGTVTTLSHGFYVAPDLQSATSEKIIGNTDTVRHAGSMSLTKNNVISNASSNETSTAGSTVVLDRINICINNLYTDTINSATDTVSSTPVQQPSPIIPAIQHKAVVQTVVTPSSLVNEDSFESNKLVIDEPDSTTTATTPHTPPITPENTPCSNGTARCNSNNNNNSNGNVITTTSLSNNSSPCSSSVEKTAENIIKPTASKKTKLHFSHFSTNTEKIPKKLVTQIEKESAMDDESYEYSSVNTTLTSVALTNTLTPPTPPSPHKNYIKEKNSDINSSLRLQQMHVFTVGEDVLIKRKDGRFYLGTVTECALPQYRIRFDDKTELCCLPDEIRKLGGTTSSTYLTAPKSGGSQSNLTHQLPMCVACKLVIPEAKVEICERCGRGYHQKCTKETELGNGVWLCKRCGKSMKLSSKNFQGVICLNLPYDGCSLTWDKNHCINEEQIYCYCGRSGTYEQNMLQCCRCLNWYHTQCTQSFGDDKLLRGDRFLVFSCSVCNQGPEFFRRLQINCVDFIHLILYNLSTKNLNKKYHNLNIDIIPYAMEVRAELPIPQEWISMPTEELKKQFHTILNKYKDRFICDRESHGDNLFYGLRYLVSPSIPQINVTRNDVLNDEFLMKKLKLKIIENCANKSSSDVKDKKNQKKVTETSANIEQKQKRNPDIYEFRPEEDDGEDDNAIVDNDSSEDELPIKDIIEKVKKSLEKMDAEDDNANDALVVEQGKLTDNVTSQNTTDDTPLLVVEEKSSSETVTSNEGDTIRPIQLKQNNLRDISLPIKSCRKRKSFTVNKNYNIHRLIETSSDENSSSSSPGTSLDLIIPPPKNFLGQNNPFLMVAPKAKTAPPNLSVAAAAGGCGSKKSGNFNRNGITMVKSSFINATTLSLSSKLAALKSAGIFPNLSTTNLAKATGQPRTVRTIKRRLSAKDITIGPNQEVKRRRNRRFSSNVEVISTTTIGINPLTTNFFPIYAKDLTAAAAAASVNNTSPAVSLFIKQQAKQTNITKRAAVQTTLHENINVLNNSSFPKLPDTVVSSISREGAQNSGMEFKAQPINQHGRRLRQRPQKISLQISRRSSVSSNSSSCTTILARPSLTSSTVTPGAPGVVTTASTCKYSEGEGLKQTVNKYFGAVNRIESGEQFSIRAKRLLANGQTQYLIEWGESSQEVITTLATTNQSKTQVDSSSSNIKNNSEDNSMKIENDKSNDTSNDKQDKSEPDKSSLMLVTSTLPKTVTPIIAELT